MEASASQRRSKKQSKFTGAFQRELFSLKYRPKSILYSLKRILQRILERFVERLKKQQKYFNKSTALYRRFVGLYVALSQSLI